MQIIKSLVCSLISIYDAAGSLGVFSLVNEGLFYAFDYMYALHVYEFLYGSCNSFKWV